MRSEWGKKRQKEDKIDERVDVSKNKLIRVKETLHQLKTGKQVEITR